MKKQCHECHNDEKSKGKFNLKFLGDAPKADSLDHWLEVLDLVTAEEMPPEDDSNLSDSDREKLIAFVEKKVQGFKVVGNKNSGPKPRRLNNREFANSVRDVLLLEDIGTNQPTANLIGDSLHHGFDTHAETLGFSRFHLEQHIEAVRKIVDATILSGDKPETRRLEVPAERIERVPLNQNTTRPIQYGKNGVFDFHDPRTIAFFSDFENAPASGNYKITIRATGKDRLIYPTKFTGFYQGDPIQLSIHLGDRVKTVDLPDEDVFEIEMNEWIAEGTRLELQNPTDAFRLKGNGNFKFQYAITPEFLKETNPDRYAALVKKIEASPNKNKRRRIDTWHNWTGYWMGARPQVFSAVVEGPIYESWPPKRQIALIGENPMVENAEEILKPIAERAWRRPIQNGDLNEILAVVKTASETLDPVSALKEGIIAILVSPEFLLFDPAAAQAPFATKFSLLLESTIPTNPLLGFISSGELDTFEAIRDDLVNRFKQGQADPFLREFPFAWLELNDINFMAPDPEHYRFYHKKAISEDMVDEVLHFFRHAVEANIPVPELLSADYSFINADLAQIYGIEGVPQDSKFRKHTFTDGRRGGFLGMGAFLTATADSLGTSPIHRAVYVMENFMGIHPTPPPPDVEITEPDVRQAKTIKEVLAAHASDETCASCHTSIDPWGYAFENFDPTGAWRDAYVVPAALENAKPKNTTIPVDASAKFRSGLAYQNIVDFREQILTEANRDRFVRCFILKILTYANGEAPTEADYIEIENIRKKSEAHDFKIVETIAATIDSSLFRGE